jgi:nicotinate phosphoribosyltransferase
MSADAPVLDLVYKLCEYGGEPRLKLGTGTATLAGSKQIWRRTGRDGYFAGDLISTLDELSPGPGWEAVLEPAMVGGNPRPLPTLDEIRQRHHEEGCPPARAGPSAQPTGRVPGTAFGCAGRMPSSDGQKGAQP